MYESLFFSFWRIVKFRSFSDKWVCTRLSDWSKSGHFLLVYLLYPIRSVSLSLSLCLPLSVSSALAADWDAVMFNACGLCCTQSWMGSSPLISTKRWLEARQAQHRSTSFQAWPDLDTSASTGPSTRATCGLLAPSQWVQSVNSFGWFRQKKKSWLGLF